MIQHVGATLWDLFSLCGGLRYLFFFVLAMIWVRLLLPVIERVFFSPEAMGRSSLHPPAAQSSGEVTGDIEQLSNHSIAQGTTSWAKNLDRATITQRGAMLP